MTNERWEEWWEERVTAQLKPRSEKYVEWYGLKLAHIKLMEEAFEAGYERGKKDEYYTGCDV